MKKILTILCLALLATGTMYADLVGKRIYIDPGHGGYTGSDRMMNTIGIPANEVREGHGFAESHTNLWKAEELNKRLLAAGATVKMYRTTNDDRYGNENTSLTERAEEAQRWAPDYMISIHSNAGTMTSNYPALFYKGKEDGTWVNGDSKERCQKLWPWIWEVFEKGFETKSYYSQTEMCVRADVDFWSGDYGTIVIDGETYYGYYRVLRHSRPGLLSEGYFHTVQPSRQRALNPDYCRQEGIRYYRAFADYYEHAADTKGYIMGMVKNSSKIMKNLGSDYANNNLLTEDAWGYIAGCPDQYAPVNGAQVHLYNSAKEKVAEYTCDSNYNGVFVFYDLEPGTYYVDVIADDFHPLAEQEEVIVEANATTYPIIQLVSTKAPEQVTTTNELNIYASGLSLDEVADGKAKISYTLNARALSLEFQVVNAAGEVIKAFAITGDSLLTKGAHTGVEVSLVGIPNGTHNWVLKASATPRTEVSTDFLETQQGYSFYQPRGLEVNVNPENPYFGYTYLANSDQGTPVGQSAVTVSGIHILDPLLVNKGGYAGGVTWVGTKKAEGVAYQQREKGAYRVQLDEKGNVYVNDNYSTTTGIWVMDPAHPEANFTPVLDREKAKTTVYNCFEVIGAGADRKLVTLESQNKFLSYAIGETTNYTGEGTVWKEYAAGTDLTSLEADGKGGFWFIRAITESGDKACLVHFNAEGVEDYSLKLNRSTYATLNLNKDKSLLALSHNTNDVNGAVYAVTWKDGVPALTEKCTFQLAIKTNHITALAFDYANNLYVGSHYSERFHAYALPSNNVCVTPAPKAEALTIENAIEDVTDELNIYASGLSAGEVTDGKVAISYTLNARALTLDFQVLNAEGAVVKTIPMTDASSLTMGVHENVEIDLAGLPAGTYTWALNASATARTTMSADFLAGQIGYEFFQPRDLEVNVNPENEHFGYVYVSNADEGIPSGGTARSIAGIHIYDNLLAYQGGYTSGVTFAGTGPGGIDYTLQAKGAFRLQLDENGYVYVNDNYAATTGIWRMDPADPEADFVSVLDREKAKTTVYNSFEVIGEGADRKLVTYESQAKFNTYAIGETATFTGDATLLKEYAAGTDWTSLKSDGKGGYWFLRAISESGDKACLVHFNAEGVEDYTHKLTVNTFAALNLNKDGSLLAVAHTTNDLEAVVYDVTWTNGVPALTSKYTFNLGSHPVNGPVRITAFAFDYANNLFVGSYYSERIHAFALPSANTCVTPAPKASTLTIEGTITNLENADIEQVQVRKVFENGMIVIIKDGVRYNVMGVKL